MNRIELYNQTVDLLLDAYNFNKLVHGNCKSCAVGSICGDSTWSDYFYTADGEQITEFQEDFNLNKTYLNTGYSYKELMEIEYAFETSIYNIELNNKQKEEIYNFILRRNLSLDYVSISSGSSYVYYTDIDFKKGQYLGLVAVLDKLKEIHEVDLVESNSNQTKLKEIYEFKSVLCSA